MNCGCSLCTYASRRERYYGHNNSIQSLRKANSYSDTMHEQSICYALIQLPKTF